MKGKCLICKEVTDIFDEYNSSDIIINHLFSEHSGDKRVKKIIEMEKEKAKTHFHYLRLIRTDYDKIKESAHKIREESKKLFKIENKKQNGKKRIKKRNKT